MRWKIRSRQDIGRGFQHVQTAQDGIALIGETRRITIEKIIRHGVTPSRVAPAKQTPRQSLDGVKDN
jgi:hypothetical protein